MDAGENYDMDEIGKDGCRNVIKEGVVNAWRNEEEKKNGSTALYFLKKKIKYDFEAGRLTL